MLQIEYFLLDVDQRLNGFFIEILKNERFGVILVGGGVKQNFDHLNGRVIYLSDLNDGDDSNISILTKKNLYIDSATPLRTQKFIIDAMSNQPKNNIKKLFETNGSLVRAFKEKKIIGYITIDEDQWLYGFVAKFSRINNVKVLTLLHGMLSGYTIKRFYSDIYCFHCLQQLLEFRSLYCDYHSSLYLIKEAKESKTNYSNNKSELAVVIGILGSWNESGSILNTFNKIFNKIEKKQCGFKFVFKPHPYANYKIPVDSELVSVEKDLEKFLSCIDFLVVVYESSVINVALSRSIGVFFLTDPDFTICSPYFGDDSVLHVSIEDIESFPAFFKSNEQFFTGYFEKRFKASQLFYSESKFASHTIGEIIKKAF